MREMDRWMQLMLVEEGMGAKSLGIVAFYTMLGVKKSTSATALTSPRHPFYLFLQHNSVPVGMQRPVGRGSSNDFHFHPYAYVVASSEHAASAMISDTTPCQPPDEAVFFRQSMLFNAAPGTLRRAKLGAESEFRADHIRISMAQLLSSTDFDFGLPLPRSSSIHRD
jgi:hypothetical protein